MIMNSICNKQNIVNAGILYVNAGILSKESRGCIFFDLIKDGE